MTQYAKRLDKSRSFGSYHPPDTGAFYTQDGYDFDHEGYIVEAKLTPEQREQLAKKPMKQPAPKKPAAAKPPAPPVEDEEPPSSDEYSADDLNLEAWLRGEEDYSFPDVQQAVKARYSVWKTSKRDLLLFLVEDQKLVEEDALSDEFKAVVG